MPTHIPVQAAEIVDLVYLNEVARAHWRKTTAKVVVNSAVETDLLNGEITIDAGAMSTNRALRLTAAGDLINNTGAAVGTPRLKLKLGATTIIDTNVLAVTWGTNVARFRWEAQALIMNLGATNSQWTSFSATSELPIAVSGFVAPTTGEGLLSSFTTTDMLHVGAGNASAVDTTAAQALALTVTLPTANTLEDMTLKFAIVEVV
jgi:hypothetical protein